MTKTRIILIILGIIILCTGIWWLTKPDATNSYLRLPLSVEATTAKIQPMPVVISSYGTVQAEQAVSILPQASGQIQQINFQEGQMVKKDQLLMVIDPRPSTINLEQAKAVLKRDQAQLILLTAEAARYKKLLKVGAVALDQYQQTVAAQKAQEATVAADQQQINQAQTELNYTKITAPISGVSGSLNVKVGDVVTANSGQVLFTINQLDPVLIDFSVPQNQLADVQHYQHLAPLQVQVFAKSKQTPLIGQLIFIDNNVNPDTGTVALKAQLANADEALWPGATMPVRLILTTEPKAVVIPVQAVQIDQQGNFVYLAKDGKAVVQRITVARQLDKLAVISQGLQGNEKVLTVIPPNIRNGAAIKIVEEPTK